MCVGGRDSFFKVEATSLFEDRSKLSAPKYSSRCCPPHPVTPTPDPDHPSPHCTSVALSTNNNILLSWVYLARGLCWFAEPSFNPNLSFLFCSSIIRWLCGAVLSWGKGWKLNSSIQLDFVRSTFPNLSGWYNDITFYSLTCFIVLQKMSSLDTEFLSMCLSLPLECKFQQCLCPTHKAWVLSPGA